MKAIFDVIETSGGNDTHLHSKYIDVPDNPPKFMSLKLVILDSLVNEFFANSKDDPLYSVIEDWIKDKKKDFTIEL